MEDKLKILEPYVVYRLMINDTLYVEVLYNKEELLIVNYGGIDKSIVRLVNVNDTAIISIGDIPRATVDLKTGEIKTGLAHIPTLFVRDYGELYLGDGDVSTQKALLQNVRTFVERFSKKGEEVNELELHTHFLEVLNGEEFFNLIKDKVPYIDFNPKGELMDRYPFDPESPNTIIRGSEKHSIDEIKSNRYLRERVITGLSIDPNRKYDLKVISKISHRRQALIELASYTQVSAQTKMMEEREAGNWKQDIANKRSSARRDIYYEMLLASLETLRDQGIKYVEFSYSTAETIASMYDSIKNNPKARVEGIEFNFLYSAHRTKSLKEFRISAGSKQKEKRTCVEAVLPMLIEGGLVKGFDLMGMEPEITPKDFEPSHNDSNGTLYDKIYTVMSILTKYPDKNLVFRLHAGETRLSDELELEEIINEKKYNPERTMMIIDRVVKDLSEERHEDIKLPPPYIRIGHGLHFNKTENYLKLLKDYKVIVEINASSNFALDNITDLSLLPYNWYLDNGIPIVISTDGGGFYLTTPLDEMMIARIFGERTERIINTTALYSKALKGGK